MKKALIVVDVQNDFCPGGALAVLGGDEVVPVINDLIASKKFDYVVFTQDWHPQNHGSFASNHPGKEVFDQIDLNGLPQVLWPVHCVQGTEGADFHNGLKENFKNEKVDLVVQKGMDPAVDSYSGFFDNGHKNPSNLEENLRERQIESVYVVGLATDFCVKATALDAVKAGFHTYVIPEGCRGVNFPAGSVEKAYKELMDNGVVVLPLERV